MSSLSSALDHVGLEMATGACVHLNGGRAGGADALPVVGRRLIALDDIELKLVLEIADRALEQRRLAGPGRADKIERQNLPALEPGPVLLGHRVVLGQNAGLELDNFAPRRSGDVDMPVRMFMTRAIGMHMVRSIVMIVVMPVLMVVAAIVDVAMIMMRMPMGLNATAPAALNRRLLPRLEIEDGRRRPVAASAMSAHHAASTISIDFTMSSSP